MVHSTVKQTFARLMVIRCQTQEKNSPHFCSDAIDFFQDVSRSKSDV